MGGAVCMFMLGGAVGYKWVKEPLDVEGEG